MRFPFIPPPRLEGRPLVLGHRGASAEAPENTLAAFRLAMAQGADGVELDVWRCGTGELVVAHDDDLRRVGGSPLVVRKASLAALRAVDVGSWKGERFRGERVPLLAEVLEAVPSAVVNVELKSARFRLPDLALARDVANLLRRSLGTRSILWLIEQATSEGLDFVYLGYWIAESQKMAYKARFQPLEALTRDGWRRLDRSPGAD